MEIPKGIFEIIKRTPVLTTEEERELILQAKKGNDVARDHLVHANLRWVWQIAKRYQGRGMPFDDLFQLGVVGLIRAIDGFDPAFSVRLTTYSTFWIREPIQKAVDTEKYVIRVPKRRNREKLRKQKDRDSAERILLGVVSLDSSRKGKSNYHSNGEDYSLSNLSKMESLCVYEDLLETLDRQEVQNLVRALITKLPDRERRVIEMRMKEMSLAAVASELGVSPEGVRVIQAKAFGRMREHLVFLEAQ